MSLRYVSVRLGDSVSRDYWIEGDVLTLSSAIGWRPTLTIGSSHVAIVLSVFVEFSTSGV